MAPLVLEGISLAEKHKNYNQLLKSTLETKTKLEPTDLNSGENELETLLQIDVASKEKNVEYILEVLKCENMLYVSYALKRCVWLINDPQYAHIMNPDYLRSNLQPQMTAKATCKLWNQIRLHLKDEKRVEEFYAMENDKKIAAKWLPNCSSTFIEDNISKHCKDLQQRLTKRICEKCNNAVLKVEDKQSYRYNLPKLSFLIHENPESYLAMIESLEEYRRPKLGKRATAKLLKNFWDRVINKFDVYGTCIHFPTFAKYLKNHSSTNIEQLIFIMVNKGCDWISRHLRYKFENVKLLINALPKEERFPFVNKTFLKIEHSKMDENEKSPKYSMRKLYLEINSCFPSYKFYEFAPFEIAFVELLKLYYGEETHFWDKKGILTTLVTCAKENTRDISTLLKQYREKHVKDERKLKRHFVEKVISETQFYRFDDSTWNILNGLFNDLDVYTDENPQQDFVQAIIVYGVLHDVTLPDAILKKMDFDLFEHYEQVLNQNEKNKLFNFLYNQNINNRKLKSVSNEKDFEVAVGILNKILTLLSTWNKELIDFSYVVEKVKTFVQEKHKYSWKTDMRMLYCVNKNWKKIFFQESFLLFPSEDVAVNALKHNSELLVKSKSQLDTLNIPLPNVLKKLRLYWSESLAKLWSESYLNKLNDTESHKAFIRNLCVLLPRQPLLDIIEKNAPKQDEIDWDNVNEIELSLQRYLAKNMHFARPQPPPQAILAYARGDYLQYALPSLLAIFYNMKLNLAREFIPKLLDAPVSVKKHGIRIVFKKFSTDELLQNFSSVWGKSKNASIRAVLFSYTYDILCKEVDPTMVKQIWQIMIPLMDNFTFEEDSKMYALLESDNVMKVPSDVRAEYFLKSYNFIKRMIPHLPESAERSRFENCLERLIAIIKDIIGSLPQAFVVEVLSEHIGEKFTNTDLSGGVVQTFSAYLLSVQNEESQCERYERVFLPLIKRSLSMWDKITDKEAVLKINFVKLLRCLRDDLEYVVENKFVIPVNLFSSILKEISELPKAETYVILTKWKLTLELAKCIQNNKCSDDFKIVCEKSAGDFGKACLLLLKEDVKFYFSDIYLLFAKCLETVMRCFPEKANLDIYKSLLSDVECKEAYFVAIILCPENVYYEDAKKIKAEVNKIVLSHPSAEVKMHWYYKFKDEN